MYLCIGMVSHKIKFKIAKHSYHCLNNKYSEIIAKTDISLSYYSFMVNEVIIQNFNIQLISQIIQINNKSPNKFKKQNKIILINFQVITKSIFRSYFDYFQDWLVTLTNAESF